MVGGATHCAAGVACGELVSAGTAAYATHVVCSCCQRLPPSAPRSGRSGAFEASRSCSSERTFMLKRGGGGRDQFFYSDSELGDPQCNRERFHGVDPPGYMSALQRFRR